VYEEMEDLYNNLFAKPHRKISCSKHRNSWEDNVKIGVTNAIVH